MMDINNAYRVAAYYDFNRDGYISTGWMGKELDFDWQAKRAVDYNRDGHIQVGELAQALARGDIFIGYDQKVHCANPFNGPQYPYPGGGSPYYPGGPSGGGYYPAPYYPGGAWNGGAYGNIVGGAAIGGAIGYVSGGKDGLGTGAVIGGFIGALSNLFGN